jgi:hypothetical protein
LRTRLLLLHPRLLLLLCTRLLSARLLLLHARLLLARRRGLWLPWLSLGAWLLSRRLSRLLREHRRRSQQRNNQKELLHSDLLRN